MESKKGFQTYFGESCFYDKFMVNTLIKSGRIYYMEGFFSSKSDHLKFYDLILVEEDLSDKNHTLEIGVRTILWNIFYFEDEICLKRSALLLCTFFKGTYRSDSVIYYKEVKIHVLFLYSAVKCSEVLPNL